MIGLIAAMPQEINAVTARMSKVSTRTVAKVEFRSGYLKDEELVVALSGVGKVHAAIAATLMCQLYQPSCLISIGVAGGLKKSQHVGDLVISDQAIQADFDTSPIDGEDGIGLRFPVDEDLLKRAMEAAGRTDINWMTGAIATQDLFMSRPEDYEKLMSRFPESACSEMEGGAVAQTAQAFSIPFLILRTLSDVVVHDDNPMEFDQFTLESSARAAEFLEAFCTRN